MTDTVIPHLYKTNRAGRDGYTVYKDEPSNWGIHVSIVSPGIIAVAAGAFVINLTEESYLDLVHGGTTLVKYDRSPGKAMEVYITCMGTDLRVTAQQLNALRDYGAQALEQCYEDLRLARAANISGN